MTSPQFESMPAAAGPTDTIGQAMRSFLAGDTLRSIAEAADISSYETLELLSSRIADRGELERSRSLRNRCFSTADVLQEQGLLVGQLENSGLARSDIPKILAALGTSIDVDIAVELLRNPDMPMDLSLGHSGVAPSPLTDELSLLYVTGHHRGVKPDYELALGKMSLPDVAALRELLPLPYRQTAEILAVIETTAQGIRAGDVSGISYSNYDDAARTISEELGTTTTDSEFNWPVPAKVLRRRMGNGFWDIALGSAGLKLASAKDRFSDADYVEAARATFRNDYHHFGSPKDVASYDGWVISETAAGRERPSVVAILRHFGAWESVIGAVMPSEIEDEYDGIVNHLKAEASVQEGWAKAGELVGEVLANMPWNSFLSIQYGDGADGPTPYAQAVPSADGVWFEIVSEKYLPADQWPISTGHLNEIGWSTPDNEFPNWSKDGVPHFEAGHQILEGFRYGRGCDDPRKLRWHTGQFPGGPGPDGGVTLDDALNGTVQTLNNAA